jgi:hypothetical protein
VRSGVAPNRNGALTLQNGVIPKQLPERGHRLRARCVRSATSDQDDERDSAHARETPLQNSTVEILTHAVPH